MDVKSVRYAANPVLEVFVAKVNQQTSVSLRESSAHRMIQRLDFGGFILLPLEVLNHYAAAVVRKVRKHPQEMGCIREDELLAGDLDYQDFKTPATRGFSAAVFARSIAERSETPPTRGRVPPQAGEGGFGAGSGSPGAISTQDNSKSDNFAVPCSSRRL
jgi:hypothetical protein